MDVRRREEKRAARRRRRQLSDEELDALLEMLHGRRPTSSVTAWAALIAAVATAVSALVTAIVALWDQIAHHTGG